MLVNGTARVILKAGQKTMPVKDTPGKGLSEDSWKFSEHKIKWMSNIFQKLCVVHKSYCSGPFIYRGAST